MELLLTSDWHIRSTAPENRTDNFLEAQEKKIDFILQLAKERKALVVISGDIGHSAAWDMESLEKYIAKFKESKVRIFAIPGQHDIPYHQLKKIRKSAFGILLASKAIEFKRTLIFPDVVLHFYPYSAEIKPLTEDKQSGKTKHIAIVHTLLTDSAQDTQKYGGASSLDFLRKHKDFDLIVSGDNHKTFTHKGGSRFLINPGSLMRSSINQTKHEPCVFLFDTKKWEYERIKIPVEQHVFDTEKKAVLEVAEEKIDRYIANLKSVKVESSSFENAIKIFLKKNSVEKEVEVKVWKALNMSYLG